MTSRDLGPSDRPAPSASRYGSVGNQAQLRRLSPSRYNLNTGESQETTAPAQPSPAETAPDTAPPAEELQGAKKPAAPACAEKAKIVPKTTTTTINGDGVIDFVANINAMMGNPHAQASPSYQLSLNAQDRVDKVNLTLNIELVVPRHGASRNVLTQAEKDLIAKAVRLISEHEQTHQAIAEQMMNQAVCAALGKSEADADKAINDFNCNKMADAQELFDLKSGQIEIDLDAQGNAKDVHIGPLAKRPNYHCPKTP
jgi:hypothetical protein